METLLFSCMSCYEYESPPCLIIDQSECRLLHDAPHLSLSLSSLTPPPPPASLFLTLLVSSRKFSLQAETDTGSSAAVYLCVYFAFGMHYCVWTLKFR